MSAVGCKVPLLRKYVVGLGQSRTRGKQKLAFVLQEGVRLRIRPVLWLLKVLLGLSIVATPLGVLSGGSAKAVMALATPWLLWLMNELVWSVLGKYRGLISLR
jgi:hypothetical protein